MHAYLNLIPSTSPQAAPNLDIHVTENDLETRLT